MFEEELEHPYSFNQLVQINAKVIAFIIARSMDGHTEVMELAVHPDYRRQGFGSQLLGYLIEKTANSEGSPKSIVLEVREDNQPAISFYRKNGFKIDGRRKGFYPDCDALLMSCEF